MAETRRKYDQGFWVDAVRIVLETERSIAQPGSTDAVAVI
jgi:hypothetical protein